jgi:four helix bundle protein
MENYLFAFEKLTVWQLAKNLAKQIYTLTKVFPTEEKYGLIQQMKRSATSICANIAEGSTRSSAKDQAHFTTIAYGSLIELLNHLIIAKELEFLDNETFLKLRTSINNLSVKLSNFKKTQLARIKL